MVLHDLLCSHSFFITAKYSEPFGWQTLGFFVSHRVHKATAQIQKQLRPNMFFSHAKFPYNPCSHSVFTKQHLQSSLFVRPVLSCLQVFHPCMWKIYSKRMPKPLKKIPEKNVYIYRVKMCHMLKYFFSPKMPCIEQSGCPCCSSHRLVCLLLFARSILCFFVGGISANALVFCLFSPIYNNPFWATLENRQSSRDHKLETNNLAKFQWQHDLLRCCLFTSERTKSTHIYFNIT